MERNSEILIKVAALFRKYGIKSITMDDISREAGISKKTLYQFVMDKSELVKKVIEFELNRTKDCFGIVCSQGVNAIGELFEVNRFVIEMMKRYSPSFEYDLKKYYPDIYQNVVIARRERMHESVRQNLIRGKKEGIYRKELQEEIITKIQISRLENLYESDPVLSIDDFTTEKIFKEIFIYHIRGIANEKGIEFLEKNIHKFDYSEKEIYKEFDSGSPLRSTKIE